VDGTFDVPLETQEAKAGGESEKVTAPKGATPSGNPYTLGARYLAPCAPSRLLSISTIAE
jgi:hypothetical protein